MYYLFRIFAPVFSIKNISKFEIYFQKVSSCAKDLLNQKNGCCSEMNKTPSSDVIMIMTRIVFTFIVKNKGKGDT